MKNKKFDSKRLIVISLMFVIIIVFSVVIIINNETLFKRETTIRYNNGCVEKYINTQLITPKCDYNNRSRETYNGQKTKINYTRNVK